MAPNSYSSCYYCLTLLSLATILSTLQMSQAANPIFLLPIIKDTAKPQYYTSFLLGTPPFRVSLSIDLSNPWSWFTCHLVGFNSSEYTPVPNSSTYKPIPCNNATCASYGSQFCYDCDVQPRCSRAGGSTCGAEAYGPYYYTHEVNGRQIAPLLLDVITIFKSNGPATGPVKVQLPNFNFDCAYYSELKGLSQYTKGILSLVRKDTSLPGLISRNFKVPRKFALCMPSSSTMGNNNGAIYFGGGPYNLPPSKLDLAQSFVTTPLVINPVDIGETFYKANSSVDYFFNVKSILVGGKTVKFNTNLLSINKKNGIGGTKLSTIDAYTTLHTEIYKALVETFVSEAAKMNITRVGSVSSFEACFSSKNIMGSRTGPNVPVIELVVDGNGSWSIYGANSMIKVSNDVRCLAFVDGGSAVKTSIVIGGKQMEDNLIEVDLESNKLGFTSLLRFGTSCFQFKGV